MKVKRRDALIALLAGGGAALGLIEALGRNPGAAGVAASPARARLVPMRSGVGTLAEHEKQLLWRLAVATGALWKMAELSESELRGFLDLKTQQAPSYLAEYRNALELLAAAGQEAATPAAVEAILRHAPGQRAAEHARQFVLAEFIALHLASGGFHALGLTRFRGFLGEGYRASAIQPGKPR